MSGAIVPIVEGHAEVGSVPVLLRRVLLIIGAERVSVTKPFRVKRNQVIRQGQLERTVQQAASSRPNAAAVLVLLDADDDCPAKLGPVLLERCMTAVALPTAVVLANRELESWFLGAKESLRGVRGIGATATAPQSVESIRGAKEHLSGNMHPRRYIAVDDQAALAARVDLQLARRRCPSFDKFMREVERLSLRSQTVE